MAEATGTVRRAIRKTERSDRAKFITDMASMVPAHAARAAAAVKALEPHVKSANALIRKAGERKDRGELDYKTVQAELAPSVVVIALNDALKTILEKATTVGDSFTLRCVRTAAITLSAYVESGLLKEGRYPKDKAMAEQFVRQNFGLARKAHADVLNALNNTFTSYGIRMPEPPNCP